MTKVVFDRIAEGLREALSIARGEAAPHRLHVVRALGGLIDIAPHREPRPVPNAADALRDDMERIGADMWRVVGRDSLR